MVDNGGFRGVILFLDKLGVYDVVLPFLLVFTIIFAILEKTKILGVEKISGVEYTKKSLNAIVAFVTAFLVIASARLVGIISEVMANAVLLVILGVCFLMLVGTFYNTQEFSFEKQQTWIKILTILMFIGIVLIFINAMGWFEYVERLFSNWDEQWATTIIFLALVIGAIAIITYTPTPKSSSEDKKGK